MSGGVDSSVSAQLLVDQGYDVVGVFMRTGAMPTEDSCDLEAPAPNRIRGCCSARDAGDAQRIADRLDIPFYALDFADEFERIKEYFADEYSRARTPNPCVVCNTWLKFGKLWDYAKAIGADRIATGHYARTEVGDDGVTRLLRGTDPAKDQSYFLFGLRYEILARTMFPIGAMPKPEVRAIAEEKSLGVAKKPDSQEICFVPDGKHAEFVKRRRPELARAGEIVDPSGRVVGEHAGIANFTIGQRKGLGVAFGEPRYVVSIDDAANRVMIGERDLLLRRELEAERTSWLLPEAPTGRIRASVKIRYLHAAAPATVEILPEGRARVIFDSPQSAVAPGQATVFYDGDRTLGGGWIV